MRRKSTKTSFAEEQDILAVQGDVRIGRKESGTEERVGAVGRLLPKDVREGYEPGSGRREQCFGRVRPQPELAVHRAQSVPDVHREDPSLDQNASAFGPRVGQHTVHPCIIDRPERAEEPVPLRDHRVRWRGQDQVDGAVGYLRDPSRVAVDEPNGPLGPASHDPRKPCHG